MSKGFASSYRIVLLAGGLFLCFGALGVRLVWLHVVDREELLRTITKTRHQLIVETARRGDILDASGAILATSRSLVVLGVDPASLRPSDERKWPQLAALLGLPIADLREIFTTRFRALAPTSSAIAASAALASPGLVFNLNLSGPAAGATAGPNRWEHPNRPADPPSPGDGVASPRQPYGRPEIELRPGGSTAGGGDDDTEFEDVADEKGRRAIRWAKLSEGVSESTFAAVEKLGIHGVYGQRVYRRVYPNNQLAAHLVGYVDREQRPVMGMEFYADFYLRGQSGWREGERDGRNRELAQFRTRDVPRADGYSVTLSIESTVQDIVEQELATIAQQFQPLKATIIVSDPRTGFILGLANTPTFNLNEYGRIPKEEQGRMRNAAVADVYEPGSTFKIVAASAALEERLVTPRTTFDCSLDQIDYQGRTLSLPGEDHRFDHPLTVAEIISRSSNKGAAQLGMLLGRERLYRYARAFGFGQPTGFPIGAEQTGTLPRPDKWDALTITRLPMGHAVDATALQMHQAMTVIANGGVLLRPQIVRKIRDASGETVYYREDGIEITRVISKLTAQTMAAMLMGVAAKEGTALEAAIAGFEVAGKTGTTQKLEEQILLGGKKKLIYSTKHHVASFVGFFPATRPQVAISVIVDDADGHTPGGTAYGRLVAAPSFKRIGERLIPILDIKSNRPVVRPNLVAATAGGRR